MTEYFSKVLASFFGVVNRSVKQRGVTILMYHRVHDGLPPGELVISVKAFRAQMQYLKKYCDVLDVQQFQAFLTYPQRIRECRRPQVFVTLDDGYQDTYLNAFPILRDLALPAIVFLATGFIGTDKKLARYTHMPAPDMLNWEQVLEMSRHKIAIGAHTVSHSQLPLLSFSEQEFEIDESMRQVEKRIPGSSARSIFCYPYGEYDQDTLVILKKFNVRFGLTVKNTINTGEENPLELGRVGVDGARGTADLIRKVNTSFFLSIKWRLDLIRGRLKVLFGKKVYG